ncbi:MAG: phosphatase PAP2 family protein [Chloroflexota bacterium]
MGQSILGRVRVESILQALASWDALVATALNAGARSSSFCRAVAVGSASGLATIEVLLMTALGIAGRRRSAGRMLVAVGLVYVGSEALGRVWRRDRPFARLAEIEALVPHSAERSFPSRHVGSGLAMAAIGRRAHPFLGRAMSGVACGLGLSRVAAGLHYPSDVLAGALLGSLIGRLLRE